MCILILCLWKTLTNTKFKRISSLELTKYTESWCVVSAADFYYNVKMNVFFCFRFLLRYN